MGTYSTVKLKGCRKGIIDDSEINVKSGLGSLDANSCDYINFGKGENFIIHRINIYNDPIQKSKSTR